MDECPLSGDRVPHLKTTSKPYQNHITQENFMGGISAIFGLRAIQPGLKPRRAARSDLRTEQGRDQHFQAFDLAKQALRVIEQAFAAMLKEYRVLVS